MKDKAYFVERAKESYHAYGQVTDFKNYQGLPMPDWDALTPKIQDAWVEAVKQVYRHLGVSDAASGELYVQD